MWVLISKLAQTSKLHYTKIILHYITVKFLLQIIKPYKENKSACSFLFLDSHN